jgi:hypothetical protein
MIGGHSGVIEGTRTESDWAGLLTLSQMESLLWLGKQHMQRRLIKTKSSVTPVTALRSSPSE